MHFGVFDHFDRDGSNLAALYEDRLIIGSAFTSITSPSMTRRRSWRAGQNKNANTSSPL
jgi:hypothetical protein